MTILFFSRLFYPHGGGVERHVLEVGRRLVKKGHRVIVVTEKLPKTHSFAYQSKSQSAKTTGNLNGIQAYRIPAGEDNWFKKFRVWKWLWQHRKLIRKADIVHAHDVSFWYFPFRFFYLHKPFYTTFHGYETVFPLTKKTIFVRKLSEELSMGNICVGDYIAKWYRTRADFVTYGGVNLPKAQISKLKSQSYNSKLKIVLIGRLENDIGITIYLEALKELKKIGVPFTFEAYGNGSLKKQVEQYGGVQILPKNLQAVIKKADIVFVSSYLSILATMVAKKLVFAVYDNQLKKDYLKMAPFGKQIVMENSAKRLVMKILYYQTHKKEMQKLIDTSYNWVKEQTWERVVDLYLKLWRL